MGTRSSYYPPRPHDPKCDHSSITVHGDGTTTCDLCPYVFDAPDIIYDESGIEIGSAPAKQRT